jgi:hypothetical protein
MPTDSATARRVIASDAVVGAELDGESVLLDVETGTYFGLDPVATDIWRLLRDAQSVDEICARLLDGYEVDPGELRADVVAFLALLEAKGLIRAAGPEASR